MSFLLRLRPFWLVPVVFWTVVVGLSFAWNMHGLERHVRDLATAQGRDIFRMIEATRLWNAQHGGIYVQQTPATQPNPYLDVEDRDIETRSGRLLTMINPAYMTRQLGETIFEQTGIRLHITSRQPINPINLADDWESDALKEFEGGLREKMDIIEGAQRQIRYMAPLETREPCLKCHRKQGYQVGQIRGGISVSFSVRLIEDSLREHRHLIFLAHLIAWALFCILGIVALGRIRNDAQTLETARAVQEALVEQRTGELRREAVERRRAEWQLRNLMDASSHGMVGVDELGHCLVCNQAAMGVLGLREEDILGRDVPALLAAENPLLSEHLRHALAGESRQEESLIYFAPDGDSFPVELRMDPIMSEGVVLGVMMTLSDVSERYRRQQEVWRQANFDSLTGLANRSLFRDRLERAVLLKGRTGGDLALLFIDLDGFKEVNDTFGHAAGDEVLIEVARRILETVRESDIAARLGGDEFIVTLVEVGNNGTVLALAEKLLAHIAQPYRVTGGIVKLSASIGVARYPEDAEDPEHLVEAADTAMYRAKQAGKHRICLNERGHFKIIDNDMGTA